MKAKVWKALVNFVGALFVFVASNFVGIVIVAGMSQSLLTGTGLLGEHYTARQTGASFSLDLEYTPNQDYAVLRSQPDQKVSIYAQHCGLPFSVSGLTSAPASPEDRLGRCHDLQVVIGPIAESALFVHDSADPRMGMAVLQSPYYFELTYTPRPWLWHEKSIAVLWGTFVVLSCLGLNWVVWLIVRNGFE